MKRLLILLTLLLLIALPALAETPPEETIAALHPDLVVTDHIMAGEDAFFLLKSPEDVRSLCVLRRENDAWAELLHSEAAICPPDRSDRFYRYLYDGVFLAWDGAILSLCYEYVTGTEWQYDFACDAAGEWRFVRLLTDHSRYPDKLSTLTFGDGCVEQTSVFRWQNGKEEISHFFCPMPFLNGCETLAGFDAAAFPMDVTSLSRAETARVAAVLLPEYTFVSGCYDDGAAFIMEKPTGERVFMGGECRDGAWLWTESQPLPEGASCDDYHGSGDSIILSFRHPEGLMCDWDEEEPLWITVVAYRQEDGRWLVKSILNDNENGFHIDEGGFPGFYINHTGLVYGTVTFERDMRYIDWSTFPLSLEEALPYLADDMGVIGVRTLPLYADAIRTEVIAEYRYATPVTIIARVGDMARVRIADSDVVGWVNAYGLLTGAEQLMSDIDDPAWDVTAEYYADWFSVPAGTAYYDAPEGSLLGTTESACDFILLAVYGDWCHVCYGESLESVWVRTADGELHIWADNLPVPEGCTLIDGWTGMKTALHLMEKPDGAVVLACFVRTETDWTLTESTPLPAGLPHGLDTFHAGEGGIRVYVGLPEERRVYEDCDDLMVGVNLQPDGTWTADGVNTGWDVIAFNRHGVYDDCGYPFYGDLPLERDITRLDWTALPGDFAQAMALVDTTRWAIVTRDDAPVQAADGSLLFCALEGAPVTILDRQEGLVHIAFMDSGVTGWMTESDLLPASEQMVWVEEDEWWDNRHHPLEYILEDENVTRYDDLHDEDTAAPLEWEHFEYITLLGRCPEECCYLIWREDAGEVLWIGAETLEEGFLEW